MPKASEKILMYRMSEYARLLIAKDLISENPTKEVLDYYNYCTSHIDEVDKFVRSCYPNDRLYADKDNETLETYNGDYELTLRNQLLLDDYVYTFLYLYTNDNTKILEKEHKELFDVTKALFDSLGTYNE